MAPGSKPLSDPRRDKAGLIAIALASVAWLMLDAGVPGVPAALVAALAAAAGLLHLWRLSGWCTLRTARYPLLWILHLAYGWIGVAFLMLAGAALGAGSSSGALHALAIGAMSSLILGMITRTALGHTGRPLRAGKAETLAFVLLQAGALARIAANLLPLQYRYPALCVAGACWSTAFLLYLMVYTPYLLRTRLDGRDG